MSSRFSQRSESRYANRLKTSALKDSTSPRRSCFIRRFRMIDQGVGIPITLSDAALALASGGATSVDLTRTCLDRIEMSNKQCGAFVTVCADSALEQASVIDEARDSGR